MPKLKNKKYYGIANENYDGLLYTSKDIEKAKKGLDSDYPYLVELTVTKVYTRERDLKEIEVD